MQAGERLAVDSVHVHTAPRATENQSHRHDDQARGLAGVLSRNSAAKVVGLSVQVAQLQRPGPSKRLMTSCIVSNASVLKPTLSRGLASG
jgi:hypothetical protein